MLMMKKAKHADGKLWLRTVLDSRAHNANTKKMASPLPNIENILCNASKHKYHSFIVSQVDT